MKISIDSAVFGLVPVPVQPEAAYEVAERPLIGREGATCRSITRARMKCSPHALTRRTTVVLALPRTRWHRRPLRHT